MKKAIFFIFLSQLYVYAFGQTDYSVCYGGQNGYYFDIGTLLQGKSYLGWAERVEIEISGGRYEDFGRQVYQIHARGGLTVDAFQVGGDVQGSHLKIYDTGAADNSSDKYKIGVLVDPNWWSICVRARDLKSGQWIMITGGSLSTMPSLPEVSFATRWLYKSEKSLFEVEGTVRSKEVKVEASPWPDYVFDEAYDLKSLAETEQYIKENKHLPNLPSAEEVSENGIELGEMNAKLLEKIEELTLHQIEMMKLIKLQQREIENLKLK